MSELPGTSQKILFQPPHFLGNESESPRGQGSECSPREPRPAESSTPSNTSPPSLSPYHQDPHCALQRQTLAAGGSLGGWGGKYDRGARREEALTWPDSRGQATDPRLHKQVCPGTARTGNIPPTSPAANLPQSLKTRCVSKHL